MSTLKILFLGDVVGKAGRIALQEHLNLLQKTHNVDLTIVNGENSAHGFGITDNIAQDFFNLGVNVITLGNHSFDNLNILEYMKTNKNIIHPANYVESYPNPFVIYEVKGYKILIINMLGKLFMHSKFPFYDPFESMEKILNLYKLKDNVDAIFIDFHAETTSEKNAFAHYFDGRVSAIIGTHTHIPTADERNLPKGSAYQSDAGMCGDYNSVIGMDINASLSIFKNTEKQRLIPAIGKATLCGCVIEISLKTGLCENIYRIKY
jgi:metallophosphoesterase (TIGR00282 family)